MALARQTDILLLDEPTTFLDLAHRVEVLDLLADFVADRGRTVVLALHDVNQACR
jgi:iron complex transport system ATP-binding protein